MKKRLWLAGAAACLCAAAAFAAWAAHRIRALDTPEFKAALLDRIRAAAGVDVQAKTLEVSLFRGVTLEGLTVANPPGFPGRLLEAEAFRLRYDLWPLLRGRLQVDEIALDAPVLALSMNARGVYNYEKLAPAAAKAPAPPSFMALPLELVLSRLAATKGRISLVDHAKATLLDVRGADLSSRFQMSAGSVRGSGTARLETMVLADALFVRDVRAPLELSRRSLRLGPIAGRLAEGEAGGDLRADFEKDLRYSLDIAVKRAQVETLLKEARSEAAMTGSLAASASFEGTGGLATLKGRGHAEVSDCKIRHSKVLAAVAAALQVPELAHPDFDECRMEFSMAAGRVTTPVLSMKSPALQLTGEGSLNLTDDAIAYDMTLALDRRLLGRVPVEEMRAAFSERADGLAAVDFRVSGTLAAPRTDLLTRIAKAGASEALKDALGRLFGRKKKP